MKLTLVLFTASLLFASAAQADEWGVSISNKTHHTATYTAEDINNDGTIDALSVGPNQMLLDSDRKAIVDKLVIGALKHEPAAPKGGRLGATIVTSNATSLPQTAAVPASRPEILTAETARDAVHLFEGARDGLIKVDYREDGIDEGWQPTVTFEQDGHQYILTYSIGDGGVGFGLHTEIGNRPIIVWENFSDDDDFSNLGRATVDVTDISPEYSVLEVSQEQMRARSLLVEAAVIAAAKYYREHQPKKSASN